MLKNSCYLTGEPNCKRLRKEHTFVTVRAKETLRKLFTDHAVYDKLVTCAVLDGEPCAESLKERLLGNAVEIGQYLGSVVGEHHGVEVTRAMVEHVKRAGDLLDATVENRDRESAVAELFENAADLTAVLCSIPGNYLRREEVLHELNHHLEMMIELINLHLEGACVDEIVIFDAFCVHMLKFADLLYLGFFA